MSKLLVALTALVIFGTGLLAWKAEAMTAAPAKAAETQSIVHKAACGGPGRWCRWGRHRVCNRWRCWCAPC
jgi:hypothetical protein